MKTTDARSTGNHPKKKKEDQSADHKKDSSLPTMDTPLAEKDEVKEAEKRTQEAQAAATKQMSGKEAKNKQ